MPEDTETKPNETKPNDGYSVDSTVCQSLGRELINTPRGICVGPLQFNKRLSTAAARTSEKCQ
jgi:hypothetical protein